MLLASSSFEVSADHFMRFDIGGVDPRDVVTPCALSALIVSADDDLSWALCEILLRDAVG